MVRIKFSRLIKKIVVLDKLCICVRAILVQSDTKCVSFVNFVIDNRVILVIFCFVFRIINICIIDVEFGSLASIPLRLPISRRDHIGSKHQKRETIR